MNTVIKNLKRSALAVALLATLTVPPPALAADTDFACADQEQVSSALLAQARQRLQGASTASVLDDSTDTVFPAGQTLGLSTTGEARGVVVRVSFPASEDGTEEAMTIPADETDDELKNMFNDAQDTASSCYPYESLHAYYERSSLGKLDIQVTQVVSYTAKYPRSHYETSTGMSELYGEAAAGVDGIVDFSQCDANNDGYIDAFYLQFAGRTGEWASTWWPNKSVIKLDSDDGEQTFDGKSIHATVLLCTKAGGDYTEQTMRTLIIHETGHVLGLPDLYSQTVPKETGVGTFDMMDNNVGEQNGLFRWLLGWITTDDITFVYTSSDGVDVRRGTGDVVHYDDAAELDLSPYTTDATAKTGGFIAISADKSILEGNLFCSFYLVQFDHRAGNQTVSGYNGELGHGVRAFRVQAGLNDDQSNFVKNNPYGVKGDQLFEVLNPQDGGAEFEYGALMHKGQVVSPTTTPSSNFLNSQEFGYSGITFEVTDETDTSARIKVSWTAKPATPEFTLGSATSNRAVNGSCNLRFTASWTAKKNEASSEDAYLLINGEKLSVADGYNARTGALDLTLRLDPGSLTSDSTIELVVPAGYFKISDDGQLSDEIRLSLDVAELQAIAESGNYEASALPDTSNRLYSDAVTDPDGNGYFFQAGFVYPDEERTLQLVRLSADGRDATSIDVDATALAWDNTGTQMKVADLGDGTALLYSTPGSTSADSRCAWIDLVSGQVLAMYDTGLLSEDVTVASLDGTAALIFHMPNGVSYAVTLKRDGSEATCSYVELAAGSEYGTDVAGEAGGGYAWTAANGANTPSTYEGLLTLYSASDVLAAANGEAAQAAVNIKLEGNLKVYDAKVVGSKVYLAACTNDPSTGGYKQQLLVYSLDGQLLSATDVSALSGVAGRIKVSDNGSVAWTSYLEETQSLAGGCYTGQVVFVDSATNKVTELGVQGIPAGIWLGNRWLAVSPCAESGHETEKDTQHMRWSLTAAIGESGGSKPDSGSDPAPAPSTDPASDTADATGASAALPKTGDTTSAGAALAVLAGALTLAFGARFARRAR